MSYINKPVWNNPFQTKEERDQIIKKLIEANPGPETITLEAILSEDQTGEVYISPDGYLQLVKHKIADQ